ncbi:hypothetical protein JMJ77_0007872 [Colletotrichum scovillei]|uniref:Uncharacterized protein n=1 Tax=Colletotrichum scovillei TaxID=1209932 RepID=A0A9P7RD25_9PEZI|nr:hypothetical protein JMJ77_0007872 [Colletotrichum scovillei]KAG7074801.1 hypothetical protein JMJ76_0011271 [Colletotrichum scovillei]KAG7081980.1 hypothetical protein JMJ78_0004089 [Colletotrichum scovillei]
MGLSPSLFLSFSEVSSPTLGRNRFALPTYDLTLIGLASQRIHTLDMTPNPSADLRPVPALTDSPHASFFGSSCIAIVNCSSTPLQAPSLCRV